MHKFFPVQKYDEKIEQWHNPNNRKNNAGTSTCWENRISTTIKEERGPNIQKKTKNNKKTSQKEKKNTE